MTRSSHSISLTDTELLSRSELRICASLLAILPLLVSCSPRDWCNNMLENEWMRASNRHGVLTREVRRPTEDERRELRNTIRLCKHYGTHFDIRIDVFDENAVAPMSTILLAVELSDTALLDQLVSEGHPVTGLPNHFGMSTLAYAIFQQAKSSFDWALEKGVDPNIADPDGNTPLMMAASYPQDRLEAIGKLVSAGADVNVVNTDGWTALAIAIRSGSFDNAKTLVNAGADIAVAREFLLDAARTVPSDEASDEIRSLVGQFESMLQEREDE